MDNEKFKEIIAEVKKFADLNMRPLAKDPPYYEIVSNKITYFPAEAPNAPISPVRCVVNPDGILFVYVIGEKLKEVSWFEDKAEAIKIVRSLSWYGLRHKFCLGLTDSEITQMVFGVSKTPPSHLVNSYVYPYQHYRSKDCLLYYPRPRGAKLENPISRCTKCAKMYYTKRLQKKKLGENPEEELEKLRRQRLDPKSKCAIRCLSPDSQAARLEARQKTKKQKLHPSSESSSEDDLQL